MNFDGMTPDPPPPREKYTETRYVRAGDRIMVPHYLDGKRIDIDRIVEKVEDQPGGKLRTLHFQPTYNAQDKITDVPLDMRFVVVKLMPRDGEPADTTE